MALRTLVIDLHKITGQPIEGVGVTVNLATKRAAYALDGLDQQIVLPDPERTDSELDGMATFRIYASADYVTPQAYVANFAYSGGPASVRFFMPDHDWELWNPDGLVVNPNNLTTITDLINAAVDSYFILNPPADRLASP